MRKLLLLLLLAFPLSAQPWYKDKKVWAVIGTSIASSAVATKEAHDCRQRKNAGIAFCDGGYGEFRAREAVSMAGSLALDGIGIWGRHMGIKEWAAPALAFTSYNTYVAAQQARTGCSAGYWPIYGTKYNCTDKPDLSTIQFIRRTP